MIAESDRYETVGGNIYFPPEAIQQAYFKPSDHRTTCGWKGVASYYTLEVRGESNPNAVWYYPDPKEAVSNIKDYVAFWKGMKVES